MFVIILPGQLLSETRHLDKELLQCLLRTAKSSENQGNPFTNFKLLFLDETGKKEFELLCNTFKEGIYTSIS